jgi:hypothetical protein
VWQQAFSVLRDSATWLFIGYSLPDADFEFRHLLKSAEKAQPAPTRKEIRVILNSDCLAELRCRRFFGNSNSHIYQCGLTDYIKGGLLG